MTFNAAPDRVALPYIPGAYLLRPESMGDQQWADTVSLHVEPHLWVGREVDGKMRLVREGGPAPVGSPC
jgi:hypothetical protein